MLIEVTRTNDGEKIVIESSRAKSLLEAGTITQDSGDPNVLTTNDVYGVEDLDEL